MRCLSQFFPLLPHFPLWQYINNCGIIRDPEKASLTLGTTKSCAITDPGLSFPHFFPHPSLWEHNKSCGIRDPGLSFPHFPPFLPPSCRAQGIPGSPRLDKSQANHQPSALNHVPKCHRHRRSSVREGEGQGRGQGHKGSTKKR